MLFRSGWAILLSLKGYSPALVDFDRDLALQTIEDGGGAIDLASDRIYKHLKERLAEFMNKIAKIDIDRLP